MVCGETLGAGFGSRRGPAGFTLDQAHMSCLISSVDLRHQKYLVFESEFPGPEFSFIIYQFIARHFDAQHLKLF